MPKLIERITRKGDQKKTNYSTTIPVNLIRIMRWKKGDELYITKLDDDSVKIEKVEI